MFKRTDDIWLNVFLGLGIPALTAIFITGITIGSDPVYLLLFAIVAISLVSFVIIRRKKRRTRKE